MLLACSSLISSPLRRYDTFKGLILSTGLIGDGIGLYFASSFMAVRSVAVAGAERTR